MNEAITLTTLGQLLGLVAVIGALWYRVETRISKGAVDAMGKAEAALRELNDFKLEVAENYAKSDLIKDVETRVLSRIDAVVNELHGMRKDFQEAMLKMAAGPRGRGR